MQNNFNFVLVRPEFLGNIGSVARVMKNFGFANLRLVDAPRNYMDAEARKMSVGAFDILKSAQVFPTLSDALKDMHIVIGTSCGHQREEPPEPIQSLSIKLLQESTSNKIAFVLGNERDGLTRNDLERCHHMVRIPTAEEFPSLNLAQAVGIICYELIRDPGSDLKGDIPPTAPELLSDGALDDELIAVLDEVLHEAGFTRTYNRDNIMSELRRFYQRAHPSSREADLIRGALFRIKQRISN